MYHQSAKLFGTNRTPTKTKPNKSLIGHSTFNTPNGGYSLKNNQTKTQKSKTKNGQNPVADIVCFAGRTFYPQWKGSIIDLQKWLMTTAANVPVAWA